MRLRRTWFLVLIVAALATTASADIYQWTDDEGTVHFTNIPPKGKGKKKWTKVMDEEPEKGSKASAKRGSCARCDVVPSRDNSPERFHRYDAFIYEAAELYKIPVPLIRAVTLTWLFSGLRSDELSRLRAIGATMARGGTRAPSTTNKRLSANMVPCWRTIGGAAPCDAIRQYLASGHGSS